MAKITQKLQFFLKTGFALIFPFGLSPKKIVFCRKVGHELNIRLCWSISALFNFEAIENKFSKSVDIEKQQTEKYLWNNYVRKRFWEPNRENTKQHFLLIKGTK